MKKTVNLTHAVMFPDGEGSILLKYFFNISERVALGLE